MASFKYRESTSAPWKELEVINKMSTGGGGNADEVLVAYSPNMILMTGFANLPNYEGSANHGMASDSSWDLACYYGNVTPGDIYKITLTKIARYDYWQTFLFGVGDYNSLIEPATNENVLKHITAINDNTYEITIPEGCYWLNVNFDMSYPCAIYKI